MAVGKNKRLTKGGKKGGKGGESHSDDSPEKLFVGGLPRTTTQESLAAHFSSFGPVASVELKCDPQGSFRGFGFVTFQDRSAADSVLANAANNMFEGKWIDCKPSGSRPGKGGGK
mmetsp:Transcript_57642/g.146323  ORF Transcript_57642/g.146323 Transcript_57642/m.146323 type:complete len:115 (+) Transcript_57642:67-411(+)